MRNAFVLFLALTGALTAPPVATQERRPASTVSTDLPLNLIKMPPGFKIDVYASGVTNAREMALGPKGSSGANADRFLASFKLDKSAPPPTLPSTAA